MNIDDNIVQLKGATKEQRRQLVVILKKHYNDVFEFIENEADYCDIKPCFEAISCWVDHIPISKPVISAKEFIDKNSN